jgi:hypothetical protein
MPIDERSSERLRKALADYKDIREVKMFGGLCFMLDGHMLCGTGWNGLMFRVGREQHAAALARGARPMEQKGRQMPGFVWVEPGSLDDRALRSWLDMARRHVATLPPRK